LSEPLSVVGIRLRKKMRLVQEGFDKEDLLRAA
jgi:hypothetical protein